MIQIVNTAAKLHFVKINQSVWCVCRTCNVYLKSTQKELSAQALTVDMPVRYKCEITSPEIEPD